MLRDGYINSLYIYHVSKGKLHVKRHESYQKVVEKIASKWQMNHILTFLHVKITVRKIQ